ncbi:hypothetical protein [Haloprofundus halobius]|uniref:hypothetical protein n=1 Tax=Haloprofundus halobius TaxID=2876194 RepID=UPI001CCAC9BD|nr:hypothetical protein [Haloprofundus halobius]
MNRQFVRLIAIVVSLLLIAPSTVPATVDTTGQQASSFEERRLCSDAVPTGEITDAAETLAAAQSGAELGACDAYRSGAQFTSRHYEQAFYGARDGAIEAVRAANNTENYELIDVQSAARGAARGALANAQGVAPEVVYNVAYGGAFGSLRAIDVDNYSASFAEAAAEGGVVGALSTGRESGGSVTTLTHAAYGGAAGAMLGVGQDYNESVSLGLSGAILVRPVAASTPGSGNAGSSAPSQTPDGVVLSAAGGASGAVEATQRHTARGIQVAPAETTAAALGSAWSASNSGSSETQSSELGRAASVGASEALAAYTTEQSVVTGASSTAEGVNELLRSAYDYTTEALGVR